MAERKTNSVTRRYLLISTSAVTAAGALGASVPFVRSWTPSEKAKALGAPIEVNISRLKPGEILKPVPKWRGKRVIVVSRTPDMIERLHEEQRNLADPMSKRSVQPPYAQNPTRSIRPELGIYLGLCTHLGCTPKYYGKVQPEQFDSSWKGGFFCPCHGSKFDLAGRVHKNLPAPTNLEVPVHQFENEHIIHVGIDTQNFDE